jgi:LysM repeat protein
VVFLSNKRKKWRGRAKEHFVQKDETMFQIAQRYGVKLMSLYELNAMQGGTEPQSGEKIKLKGRKRKDSVRTRTDLPVKSPVVTQPGQNGRPATTPDPSPFKPTDGELFELGEGGVVNPDAPSAPAPTPKPTKPTTPPAPGRPATTGSDSRPDAPPVVPSTPAPSRPTSGTSGSTTSTWQPASGGGSATPTAPAATPAGYHTVIKGDTLYNISKRYGLSVDQLRALNNMTTNDIKIGQLMKVK